MGNPIKDRKTMMEMGKIDEPKGIIRMEIEEGPILELADSIKAMGQLQPILLRPVGKRYEIVYGHRRFLANQRLGNARIWVTIKELNDVDVALMRATENIARLDISPVEEAAVYMDLYENHKLDMDQIAKRMGKTVGIVKRRMDLLAMPSSLQEAVHRKQISYGVAESLWRLKDEKAISYYLPFAIEHGATVAVCRVWIKDHEDSMRRQTADGVGGGGLLSPFEEKPIYVACDMCRGSMKLGSETAIRCCPQCTKTIKQAFEGGEE